MDDLVTIEEAREHLRFDDTANDPWLLIWIPAVSAMVRDWLKDDFRLYEWMRDADNVVLTDSNDEPIPVEDSNGLVLWPSVKAAVLVELAAQNRYREGEGTDNVVPPDAGHGYVLNKTSTAILAGRRKSTVA